MGNKVIIILLWILSVNNVFAQIMGTDKLLFELYDTVETQKFNMVDSVLQWTESQLSFSKSEHEFCFVENDEWLFCYISGCSGQPCLNVYCLKKSFGQWYLISKASMRVIDRHIHVHYDENKRLFVFSNSSDVLGRLRLDALFGIFEYSIDKHLRILYYCGGNDYIIDVCDFVVYKNNEKRLLDKKNNLNRFVSTGCGDILQVNNQDTVRFITHKKINKRKIISGFFNLSVSDDNRIIVCERHVYRKKKLFLSEIVEIDTITKDISVLPINGENPKYSCLSDNYILYQHGDFWQVYNKKTRTNELWFIADNANWL